MRSFFAWFILVASIFAGCSLFVWTMNNVRPQSAGVAISAMLGALAVVACGILCSVLICERAK